MADHRVHLVAIITPKEDKVALARSDFLISFNSTLGLSDTNAVG
jgi:hypothetical protein